MNKIAMETRWYGFDCSKKLFRSLVRASRIISRHHFTLKYAQRRQAKQGLPSLSSEESESGYSFEHAIVNSPLTCCCSVILADRNAVDA